jgi:hypothetical protein
MNPQSNQYTKYDLFPYPILFLETSTNRVVYLNVNASTLLDIKPDTIIDPKYLLPQLQVGGKSWVTYYEQGLLFLLPDNETEVSATTKNQFQQRVLFTLTGIIGAYLGFSLWLASTNPNLKDSQVFAVNKEAVGFLVGAYTMALGSLFKSDETNN